MDNLTIKELVTEEPSILSIKNDSTGIYIVVDEMYIKSGIKLTDQQAKVLGNFLLMVTNEDEEIRV